jgi:hypothetical protein
VGHMNTGFVERFPGYADWLAFDSQRHPHSSCISDFTTTNLEPCYFGADYSGARILAVGDSHMNQWVEVIEEVSSEKALSIALVSKSACAIPIVNYNYNALRREYSECTEWRENLIEYINQYQPTTLVIQNSSVGYAPGSGLRLEEWGEGLRAFMQEIDDEINVLWILDNPRYPPHTQNCIERAMLNGLKDEDCSITRESALSVDMRNLERTILQDFDVSIIDFTEDFCDGYFCFGLINGVPLMADSNHISQAYIRKLKPKFVYFLLNE